MGFPSNRESFLYAAAGWSAARVLAPTGKAVDVAVREGAGDTGHTMAKALQLLGANSLHLGPETLVVVDEAGMVGTDDLRQLSATTQAGAKTVLVGDAHQLALGPASLVLFDVSTLYFETDAGDGFREPGFSKERRLEPQITLGLLTDAAGFPLTVEAFEGNKAETLTMLPVINAFKAARQLSDVTVVADAGMISEANQVALQAAGLSFILGTRIPHLPDVVREWRDKHPGEAIPDGLTLTQPWPATSSEKVRGIPDRVIYYQFRHVGPGARCAGSTSRSARPSAPSTDMPRSNVTATSSSPVPPRASTAPWRPRPVRWPAGRDTPPT